MFTTIMVCRDFKNLIEKGVLNNVQDTRILKELLTAW